VLQQYDDFLQQMMESKSMKRRFSCDFKSADTKIDENGNEINPEDKKLTEAVSQI
jgi:hypothetical protein